MRIDPNRQAQESSQAEALSNSAVAQSAKKAESASAQSGDTVKLSPFYEHVAELAQTASQAPEIRQDKVDSLKAAIQDGRYQVSSDQTAGALYNDLVSKPTTK